MAILRRSEDSVLRESGFTIHARPSNGMPVWRRGSKQYPQAEALRIAHREQRDAIRKLESKGR